MNLPPYYEAVLRLGLDALKPLRGLEGLPGVALCQQIAEAQREADKRVRGFLELRRRPAEEGC